MSRSHGLTRVLIFKLFPPFWIAPESRFELQVFWLLWLPVQLQLPLFRLTLRAAPLHRAVTATLVQLAAAAGAGHGEGHPCRGDGIDERCLPRPCKAQTAWERGTEATPAAIPGGLPRVSSPNSGVAYKAGLEKMLCRVIRLNSALLNPPKMRQHMQHPHCPHPQECCLLSAKPGLDSSETPGSWEMFCRSEGPFLQY